MADFRLRFGRAIAARVLEHVLVPVTERELDHLVVPRAAVLACVAQTREVAVFSRAGTRVKSHAQPRSCR